MTRSQYQLGILSPSNVEFLAEQIKRTSPYQYAIYTPPFGQDVQVALSPHSELYRWQPEFIMIFVDGADIFGESLVRPFGKGDDRTTRAGSRIQVIKSMTESIHQILPKSQIILNTVPNPPGSGLGWMEPESGQGLGRLVSRYNSELAKIASGIPGAVVFDYQYLANQYGLEAWYDRRMWYLARSPMSMMALKHTGAELTAFIAGLRRPRAKCIVVDLDNTCWGGTAGDDGPANVKVGTEGIGLAYAEFQRALLNLRDQGVLIAIASKNDPSTVDQVFETHAGMVLSKTDISSWQVGWGDKATALKNIAQHLSIGLSSLVFIDDNPAERDLVRRFVPEATVIEMPEDPSKYVAALLAEDSLKTLSLTSEDRARAGQYHARQERLDFETNFVDLEQYLISLEMEATIGEVDALTINRVTQLIQKTNQFNLTARNWSHAELSLGLDSKSYRVFWIRLRDKFADEGLVGAAVVEPNGDTWNIANIVMSCRVVGRGVESALLSHVGAEALASGAKAIEGAYVKTERNQLTEDLLVRHGFKKIASRWVAAPAMLAGISSPNMIISPHVPTENKQ